MLKERISPTLVERTTDREHAALVAAGYEHPPIGVCGISSHGGENGLLRRGKKNGRCSCCPERPEAGTERRWAVAGRYLILQGWSR
jgi:hypothetical protein